MPGTESHLFFIWSAYGMTAIVLAGLVAVTWLDWRRQRRLLDQLEQSGAPRRRKPAVRHRETAL